ncbi:YceD family protein [Enterococcus sp.]|uniref:YceD family protein n=1 Tax=Enterococcus sp. TaxID=35783 RepID=UPI002FC99AF6
MKWSLLELRKYQEEPLVFQETLDLQNELISREKEIIAIRPIQVSGLITVSPKEYLLHYTVDTVITLPSTRSLEPVEVPMTFTVDEVFMTTEQYQQQADLIGAEEVLLLETQTLNLSESVADNILLEIPLQVLTEEEQHSTDYPSGDEWTVVSEDQYKEMKESQGKNQIDPRLAKLSALLGDQEDNS